MYPSRPLCIERTSKFLNLILLHFIMYFNKFFEHLF
nr:MAG TPA: hypothetical protein [Caudoviricetes sp.]